MVVGALLAKNPQASDTPTSKIFLTLLCGRAVTLTLFLTLILSLTLTLTLTLCLTLTLSLSDSSSNSDSDSSSNSLSDSSSDPQQPSLLSRGGECGQSERGGAGPGGSLSDGGGSGSGLQRDGGGAGGPHEPCEEGLGQEAVRRPAAGGRHREDQRGGRPDPQLHTGEGGDDIYQAILKLHIVDQGVPFHISQIHCI